jgi:hypothetical protein
MRKTLKVQFLYQSGMWRACLSCMGPIDEVSQCEERDTEDEGSDQLKPQTFRDGQKS